MPRANRYFLPGHVWHITHRCHKRDFLLKFAHDRRRWLYWLFESRQRYRIIDLSALRELFAIGDLAALQRTHAQRVANALRAGHQQRDRIWSESLAVGDEAFVQGVKTKLGLCAYHREVVDNDDLYSLREPVGAYQVNCSSMIAL